MFYVAISVRARTSRWARASAWDWSSTVAQSRACYTQREGISGTALERDFVPDLYSIITDCCVEYLATRMTPSRATARTTRTAWKVSDAHRLSYLLELTCCVCWYAGLASAGAIAARLGISAAELKDVSDTHPVSTVAK